ncbi:MAG: hypothetical protein COA79_21145 [Planctomycetota bacterium]|nr:MAG: hypothetical protein COA79_21145 [Planctomycetota bacterium]
MYEKYVFKKTQLSVAKFGYTLASIDEIKLIERQSFVRTMYDIKGDRVRGDGIYLIPDFNSLDHKEGVTNRLPLKEYDNYFEKYDLVQSSNFSKIGIADEFSKLGLSLGSNLNEELKINNSVKIISFANKYGLLSNSLFFNYIHNPFKGRDFFYCDNIDTWKFCFIEVQAVLFYLNKREKLKMEDFTDVVYKNDELVSAKFLVPAPYDIDKVFYFKNDGTFKSIKRNEINKIKRLLEYSVLRFISTHLQYTTWSDIDEVKSPNQFGLISKPLCLKGAIFLDLASQFMPERIWVSCKKCKKPLEITKAYKNKKFHDTCYDTYKKFISRWRKKGKTDEQIATELGVDEL